MKTSAFTNHVVPKSSANCTTLFVSRRRNAAPMKKRSVYGWSTRNPPVTARTVAAERAGSARARPDRSVGMVLPSR